MGGGGYIGQGRGWYRKGDWQVGGGNTLGRGGGGIGRGIGRWGGRGNVLEQMYGLFDRIAQCFYLEGTG